MKHKFIIQQKTISNGYSEDAGPLFKEIYFIQFVASNGAVMNHYKTFDDIKPANALFIAIHTAIACGKLVRFDNPNLWVEVEPVYGSKRHQELSDEVFA